VNEFQADIINGIFETFGAWFTWGSAWKLWKDRDVKGVYWPAFAFFGSWGLWNLLYYPTLDQWLSFAGGILLVSGNIAWVLLYLYWRWTGDIEK
jgi:hypothetical protein